ncbi:hypothetical protein [Deinococcus hohokamensis]|uniref:Uncharacterized protein n=1 Tax=Deinococcus hohokamensis TaxID=309883 RepID=A0ABV9ICH2_9DEIO
MSAITRGTPDDSRREREDLGREAAGPARAAPHPSWKFQDRFELWIDWMARDSAGHWHPHQSVLQRTCRTREETLLHAERLIQRGDFPMQGRSAAPVTLIRNRREALLAAFREAEGDGVTLIREVLFPVGEYALSLKVTRERVADEVRTGFAQPGNPLRSLAGQPVKLTVLIEHPYDVLSRAEGILEMGELGARVGQEVLTFQGGAAVTGVPYRQATVAVSRGLLKKPMLYRFELAQPAPGPAQPTLVGQPGPQNGG